MRKKVKSSIKYNHVFNNFYVFFLLLLSVVLFSSLTITSYSLETNIATFSKQNQKNDFIIYPDFEKLDQMVKHVKFYEFDSYQRNYRNTNNQLNFLTLLSHTNIDYLSNEEINELKKYLTDDILKAIQNSDNPSSFIYNYLKQQILKNLDENFPYREDYATIQAKSYTRLILLLTLNETNYYPFVDFVIDDRLKEYRDIFIYEKREIKSTTEKLGNNSVNFYLMTPETHFNKPYIVESLYDSKELVLNHNEVAIFKEFALHNNLQLGDTIKINGVEYKVVSFVYLPNFIYPLFDLNKYYYEITTDTVVVMNETNFNQIEIKSLYNASVISASFINEPNDLQQAIADIKKDFRENQLYLIAGNNPSDWFIHMNLKNINLVAILLSSTLLVIMLINLNLVLKRKLNEEEKKIGLLKALGYRNNEIKRIYLHQFTFVIFLVIITGLIIGSLISFVLLETLSTLFLLPDQALHLSLLTVVGLIVSFTIILFLTHVFFSMKLKNKTVNLLSQVNQVYINENGLITSKTIMISLLTMGIMLLLSAFFYFNNPYFLLFLMISCIVLADKIYPYKQSFIKMTSTKVANRYIKKIVNFNIVIFFTSLLLFFGLFSLTVFPDLIENSKNNHLYTEYLKYPNILKLTQKDLDCEDCEGFFTAKLHVLKINNLEINDDFSFNGYPEDITLFKITDNQYNNLLPLLKGNDVVVTRPFANQYHLKIGDTITILTNKMSYDSQDDKRCQFGESEQCQIETLTIKGISNNLIGFTIFTNIEQLNEWYFGDDMHDGHINTVYTKQPIDHLDQSLKKNLISLISVDEMMGQLDKLFYALKIILFFSFILIIIISVIILFLIMEITIKENTSQIVLLKSIGYKNKEIFKILLGFYKGYVRVIYLLMLPISFMMTHQFFFFIGLNVKMAPVLNFHIIETLICLLILYAIYFITTRIAEIKIKKMNLANSLKG